MSKLDEKLQKLKGEKTERGCKHCGLREENFNTRRCIAGFKHEGMDLPVKVEKLKRTGGKTPGHGPLSNNGGARIGAGKKPMEQKIIERGWKVKLDQFHDSEMIVQITDPKTGQVRKVPKNRVLIALETLFNIGVTQKDVDALSKYLDRALGKPKQPLTGGEEGDEPIKTEVVGLGVILDKAYPDDE